MKAIVCEMCGSQDLVKQDGVYVCQNCGTKYSVEEAKKLMTDGVVKIDNSDKLNNLYQVARRAKSENNTETAAEYYNLILQEDPNSWEAVFFSTYFKATNCRIIAIVSAANSIANSLGNVFTLIARNVDADKQKTCYKEVANYVLAISDIFYLGAADSHSSALKRATTIQDSFYKDAIHDFFSRVGALFEMLIQLGDQLEKVYIAQSNSDSEIISLALRSWKQYQSLTLNMYNAIPTQWQAARFENCKDIANIVEPFIKRYEPSHTPPFENMQPPKASSGCYVATAVYGSYDCPQVWTLRRYRDYTLAETWYGRAFIRTYYTISPTLVRWFGNTQWFRNLWKPRLDRMVDRLNREGVDNTPYSDRQW